MGTAETFMAEAIRLAMENVKLGKGGPFGAVIVKEGKIIGKGVNTVTASNDPTCHAEVNAIRDACKNLRNFQLTDCDIYTSCEPCPMCMGAIYWARPRQVFFAAGKTDAASAGFDDTFIYEEIPKQMNMRRIPFNQLMKEKALEVFNEWGEQEDKMKY